MNKQKCCFCIKLQQGFFKILYLDIFRLFFGLFISIMTFSDNCKVKFDIAISATTLAAIFLQTISAMVTYFKGVPTNNHNVYKYYEFSKAFYITINITQFILLRILRNTIVSIQKLYPTNCQDDYFYLIVIASICWNMVEIYFFIIVHRFRMRTANGFYGPYGTSPFGGDQNQMVRSSKRLRILMLIGRIIYHRRNVPPDDQLERGTIINLKKNESEKIVQFQKRLIRPKSFSQGSLINIIHSETLDLNVK